MHGTLSPYPARLERTLSRLGARLGAAEHAGLRLPDELRARVRPVLARLDDELWRIDLRLVARGSDELLLERELAAVESELAAVEELVRAALEEQRRVGRRGLAEVIPLARRPVVPEVA